MATDVQLHHVSIYACVFTGDWYSCQGDRLSGKHGNVGEFSSCQGNVRKLAKKSGNCRVKLFIANSMFGFMPVFSSNMHQCIFYCLTWVAAAWHEYHEDSVEMSLNFIGRLAMYIFVYFLLQFTSAFHRPCDTWSWLNHFHQVNAMSSKCAYSAKSSSCEYRQQQTIVNSGQNQ